MKKENFIQIIVVAVLLAILGGAVFFIYRAVKEFNSLPSKEGATTSPQLSPSKGEGGGEQEKVYTHPDYGFTLRYPGNLNLGKFPEGEGEIILLQGQNAPLTKGGGGIEGFQIFISAYDEKEPLSKEIILKSAPKLSIKDEKDITLGQEEIPALSFNSENESTSTSLSTGVSPSATLGTGTHEVWFVVDGNLYQCTSFTDYGARMERILGSFTFN